jgi:Zn-dependent protease
MGERENDIRQPAVAASHSAPPDLDFHLPHMDTSAQPDFILPPLDGMYQPPQPSAPPRPSKLKQWESRGGLLGTIATALIFLLKVGAPIIKAAPFLPKLLVTGGSMLLSIWLEAMVFGWAFAAGIVLLIFIHECGHAFAAKQRGCPFSFMLFIPFMGAMVAHKRGGRSVVEDAYIGIMGPVFGTLAGFACLGIFFATGGRFWLVLAQVNFMINLFNLLPTAPLDGGWIVPVFSPKLLAVGVVLLVLVAHYNPFIWLLAIMSLPRIIGHWKASPNDPFYRVTSADRWRYGIAYLGLIGILAYSNLAIRQSYRPARIGTVDIATQHAQPDADQDDRPIAR